MPPLSLYVNKLQRNMVYETIAKTGIDPAQFNLEVEGKLLVTHNAGSTFEVVWGDNRRIYRIRSRHGRTLIIKAIVEDGLNKTCAVPGRFKYLLPLLQNWAVEVKQVTEAPDYWEEMKRGQALITDIQDDQDSENTPFTEDEQDEIAARLEDIKKNLTDRFELSNEQTERVEEKLDEAAQASKRMGRKDWLMLFGGTIFNLIVTDTVTPIVAQHIFTVTIHGLIHLFTGGSVPPQIPPQVIT